jgi:curved DNA-binding protein CbpA
MASAEIWDDDLRRAYRELARRYHPDRHPHLPAAERTRLAAQFADVTAAYRTLITTCAETGSRR